MSNEAGESILGGGNGAVRQLGFAPIYNPIGDFHDHFLQKKAEVAASAEITGSNIIYAAGMGTELITFAEAAAGFVLRIVNCNRVTTIFAHDSKAGDIGRPVADVDHVGKRHGTQRIGHMIIHVLIGFQHTLIYSEQVLRLLGVTDYSAGE